MSQLNLFVKKIFGSALNAVLGLLAIIAWFALWIWVIGDFLFGFIVAAASWSMAIPLVKFLVKSWKESKEEAKK